MSRIIIDYTVNEKFEHLPSPDKISKITFMMKKLG